MKRDQLTFLAVGFAFGALFGVALFMALDRTPQLDETASAAIGGGPAGPSPGGGMGGSAPAAGGGGAPMMAEIRELRKRVEADPKDEAALQRLANLYHDVQMWDEAIGYYTRALEVRPDQPDLLTDLGICYRAKGEYDAALEQFRRAYATDQTHWQSLFNIVVVTGFDLQQFAEARKALETMQRIEPTPPRLDELREALERAEAQAAKG